MRIMAPEVCSDFSVRSGSSMSLTQEIDLAVYCSESKGDRPGFDELVVRNTFIHASRPEADHRKKARSCPPRASLEATSPASPRRPGGGHLRLFSETLIADMLLEAASPAADGALSTTKTGIQTPSTVDPYCDYETDEEFVPFYGSMASDSVPLSWGGSSSNEAECCGQGLNREINYWETSSECQSTGNSGSSVTGEEAPNADALFGFMTPAPPTNTFQGPAQFCARPVPMVPVQMQPSTSSLRREMLRAKGMAVVEATGKRCPQAAATTSSGKKQKNKQQALAAVVVPTPVAPGSLPPGTFITPQASPDAGLKATERAPGAFDDTPSPKSPLPSSKKAKSAKQRKSSGVTAAKQETETPAAEALMPPGQFFIDEDLPSRGSAKHKSGLCKPCAFVFEGGCMNAKECEFCHLCDRGERTRRKREKLLVRKETKALANQRSLEQLEERGVLCAPKAGKLPWESEAPVATSNLP